MFWLSYECFSILYDAFLLKSAISSHTGIGGHDDRLTKLSSGGHKPCYPANSPMKALKV